MRNTLQLLNWLSRISLAAASAALLLAAVLVSAVSTTPSAQAQTLTTLHSFDDTDGAEPMAGMVQATDGNLYGTTSSGGVTPLGVVPSGTVFQITPSGALITWHSFVSTDGATPKRG